MLAVPSTNSELDFNVFKTWFIDSQIYVRIGIDINELPVPKISVFVWQEYKLLKM